MANDRRLPDSSDWRMLDRLLDELLDAAPGARETRLLAFLEERPDLAQPMRRLLAGAEHADQLDSALGQALQFLISAEMETGVRRVGPWRLVSLLGQGGMAQVYLAERADGAFEQRVALKLLWPGLARPDMLARFEQERQILAALDDERIARLIDGGITGDGRPWLAMDYVEGLPIDQHCDRHRLTMEQRLALFCQVTAALGAAHRRLVVHRDLKPANVMVTADGRVKLLDFGIAKLLDGQSLPHAAPVTRRAERLLTPEYASPEQLVDEPVTTASDIYQLGALLFQLLTGQPPHRRQGISTAEFERRVLAGETPSLSARVRDLDGVRAERLAAARRTTPNGLIRYLRGDLEAIIAQSMAADPDSRYASADALQQDVRCVLDGLPVTARPAHRLYRLRKFVRRHRVAAAVALLLAATVIAGLAGTTWQARIAAAEARKAEEIKHFLVSLFEVSDPDRSRGRDISARELLDQGAERIRSELVNEPAIQAELLYTLGGIYRRLGLYEQAAPLLDEALQRRLALYGPNHVESAQSLNAMGRLLYEQGEFERAEALLWQALDIRRRLLGPDHLAVGQTLAELIDVLRKQMRHDDAEPLAYELLALRRRAFDDDHPGVAQALRGVAMFVHRRGDVDQAETMYREVLRINRRYYGEPHLEIARTLHNLALVLRQRGDLEQAEAVARQSLAMKLLLQGEVYTESTVQTLGLVGRILDDAGDLGGAERAYRKGLDELRGVVSADHPALAGGLHALGSLLQRQDRLDEAEPLLAEGLEIRRRVFGADHATTLSTELVLGSVRLAMDREAAAEALRVTLETVDGSAALSEHLGAEIRLAREALGRR